MNTQPYSDNIIYEHPLNDAMRICLKLEQLFALWSCHMQQQQLTDLHSQQALHVLVDILDVIARPDLKSKLAQTLTQHATTLAQLEQFPQVDPVRLTAILSQLDGLIESFNGQKTRVGEQLRQHDFIHQVRLRRNSPGGYSISSAPMIQLWLHQPLPQRQADLAGWFSEFVELEKIVHLILFLTRNSSEPQQVCADQGFYQQTLDPNLPCEIVRLAVPLALHVYPELSVGRHRMVIRFARPAFARDMSQQAYAQPVEFQLTCCRI